MYDKVFEQAGSFFKPMTAIMELNAEAFDTLRTKQTDLLNEVVSDSIEYAKGFSKPNMDVDTLIETQQIYWEGIREKLTTSAQDSYEVISETQGKVGDLITGAFDGAVEAPKAPVKKKPAAKKASPKKAGTPA
ncbi:MAG: phasin family protein [Agarilytica sp.]